MSLDCNFFKQKVFRVRRMILDDGAKIWILSSSGKNNILSYVYTLRLIGVD